jgi:hypothetical protein
MGIYMQWNGWHIAVSHFDSYVSHTGFRALIVTAPVPLGSFRVLIVTALCPSDDLSH